MNLQAFIKRIQETPLFNEEQRAYFLSRAESYTDVKRQEMVNVLESHEKKAIELIKENRLEEKKLHAKESYQKMLEREKLHEEEIQLAESQLEEDLNSIIS